MIVGILNSIYPELNREFSKADLDRNTELIILTIRLTEEHLRKKYGRV